MHTPILSRIAHYIDHSNDLIGRSIAWLTLFMVLTQFSVVVLRSVFNIGWIAMQESILYMHALVFMLGAAYTLRHDAHVRVDIFYQHLSVRGKAWVDLLGSLLLLLPVCIFIFMMSWEYVVKSWAIMEGSREAGGLPGLYLLNTSMLILPILLGLQGISMILRNLLVITGHSVTGEAE